MIAPAALRPTCPRCTIRNQIRQATLLRRPKRPYTFTQLVTLSDGSTFTHRTTSPQPIYKSTRDTKNSVLWNPSSQKLLNIEEDEAGRLKRFRERFGRGFDADAVEVSEEVRDGEEGVDASPRQPEENLLDLISGYGQQEEKEGKVAGRREPAQKSGKGKGGQK